MHRGISGLTSLNIPEYIARQRTTGRTASKGTDRKRKRGGRIPDSTARCTAIHPKGQSTMNSCSLVLKRTALHLTIPYSHESVEASAKDKSHTSKENVMSAAKCVDVRGCGMRNDRSAVPRQQSVTFLRRECRWSVKHSCDFSSIPQHRNRLEMVPYVPSSESGCLTPGDTRGQA